jgi:hypothetical protein
MGELSYNEIYNNYRCNTLHLNENMKIKRLILTLTFTLYCIGGSGLFSKDINSEDYTGKKDKLHIYLLIGQSNMAGRAPFTKEESSAIKGVYLFNNKEEWEPAKNPLNRYSTIRKGLNSQKMNPGFTFSKTMLKKNKGISIGLIVNAKGGSSIKSWAKDSKFYKEAVKRTTLALKSGLLKGILWHQGESDSKDSEYLSKLVALVKNLRNDFKSPNLPFVAGQVNNVPLINQQIMKLPELVEFSGFTSSTGLTAMDRWHFDSKSMKLLGQRYAMKMLEIQAQKTTAKK